MGAKSRRKFIDKGLLWVLPVITGVIFTVAYMGPIGVEVMFEKWLATKAG